MPVADVGAWFWATTMCDPRVSQHPTRDDLHNQYFADRSDGLTPWTVECLIAAVVPG